MGVMTGFGAGSADSLDNPNGPGAVAGYDTSTSTEVDLYSELDLTSEVRVGDTERNEVILRLREASNDGHLTLAEFEARSALAYNARVRSELVKLLDDLPTDLPETQPVRVSTPGPRSSKWVMGILGAGRQQGHFRPAPLTNAISVGGTTRFDLTEAEIVDSEMVIRAFAFFGHVDVVVPENVETDMSGLAILGSRSHRPKGPTPPGAPRVMVKAYSLCGFVTVRNRRRLRRGKPAKADRSNRAIGNGERPALTAKLPRPWKTTGAND